MRVSVGSSVTKFDDFKPVAKAVRAEYISFGIKINQSLIRTQPEVIGRMPQNGMNGTVQKTVFRIKQLIRVFWGILDDSISSTDQIIVRIIFYNRYYLVQVHILILMSGQRFQSVDRFIEAVYPVSHIAEQQVQTVPLADRKEVIRAEFSAIDHISL